MMSTRIASKLRLSASFRLILAVWRLQASIESDFGKSILHILNQQFPGQEVKSSASEIGKKLMMIAKHELQKNETDAQDSIMDFITYLSVGSKYETDDDGKIVYEENEDGESKPVKRKTSNPWNFAKDFDDPNLALKALYTNLKRRSIDKSKAKSKKIKQEKSVDQAFGKRGEGSNVPEGGEGRMPTPDDTSLGKALDDKAAVKEFIKIIDKHIPDLINSLPFEQKVLFDLVYEDEIGSFGSDVKENMGQASALEEKLTRPDASPEEKALYEKNAKRWSGFVGDTRKKLLESIRDFIDYELPQADIDVLWDEFFSNTTPQSVARKEKAEADKKGQYQTDIDKRKLGRLKWVLENGENLSKKEQDEYDRLVLKLKKLGINEEDVQSLHPDAKGSKLKKVSSVLGIASFIADIKVNPLWMV